MVFLILETFLYQITKVLTSCDFYNIPKFWDVTAPQPSDLDPTAGIRSDRKSVV